jgi:LPS sulfotransferase NodH
MMTAYDREWQHFFLREAIDPVRISYDALAANPAATVRDILDGLGLDSTAAVEIEPGTKKIADEISRDWVARFRAE